MEHLMLKQKEIIVQKSRQEVEAEKIMRRIHEHDINLGGTVIEITGAPGAGKTSAMLSMVNYALVNHPNEICYWSSAYGSPLQFFPIGKGRYQILCAKDMDIKFWDRINLNYVDLNVIYFDDFEDLYQKSKPGILNCIFFGDRTRNMEFLEFLMSKAHWHNYYIDEISEVTSATTSGKDWKRIAYFADHTLGQARKCGLSIVMNTQAYADTDARVRRKLQIKVFLPGAKADRRTRVTQKAIDNLRVDYVHGNTAYIVMGGTFGVIQYKDIYKPLAGISIEARTSFKRMIYEPKRIRPKQTAEIDSRGHTELSNEFAELRLWKDRQLPPLHS